MQKTNLFKIYSSQGEIQRIIWSTGLLNWKLRFVAALFGLLNKHAPDTLKLSEEAIKESNGQKYMAALPVIVTFKSL